MNKCTSEVENVNKSCLCKTLDKEVLFNVLGDSPLSRASGELEGCAT